MLNHNDFHWTNLALSRRRPVRAVVYDYHLLGIGLAWSDCRNVLSSLAPPAGEAFLRGGDFSATEQAGQSVTDDP